MLRDARPRCDEQDDSGELPASEILLMANVLVGGDQDLIAIGRRTVEQFTVAEC